MLEWYLLTPVLSTAQEGIGDHELSFVSEESIALSMGLW
jgi:hypothetical protein